MFDGETIEAVDIPRLQNQLSAVYEILRKGEWVTLPGLQKLIPAATTPSLSARVRDLRKPRYGGRTIERRRVTESGLFEYRMLLTGVDLLGQQF